MSDCLLGILFSFSLLLAGVSGADDVTVSVMMGDNVTLLIKPGEINERLQWKYKNSIIASFNLQYKDIPAEYPDKRFTNRLIVDPQNGSLTVKNIGTEDTGEYQLEIKTSRTADYKLFRTFSVTVNDEEMPVSKMEGGTLTLKPDTETQEDDVIEWTFEGTPIAKMDRKIHPISDYVLDERFRGRLHVDMTGFLIITPIKTNESGLYDVKITNSKNIIHKRFSVTVTASSSRSHQVMIGPGLFVVVMIMSVIVLV